MGLTGRRGQANRVGVLCLLLAFSFLNSNAFAQKVEKKEALTVQELTQSKANQQFIVRKYAEALEEFKKLEREYPKDIVIKRYIGASLDHLQRDSEAIEAFQKVLKLKADDLPSRQFLAKIYLRQGELDKAEEQFTYLVTNDPQGNFGLAARGQLEQIQRLRATEEKAVEAQGRQIRPDDFAKTKAAKAFMAAKYEDALGELDELAKKYPDDILIKRYRGIGLDKLGRFDEAILAYQDGLAVTPENIPLHYFLAQSLLHKQDLPGAEKEFEYVVANDESRAYQARAKADLDALKQLIEARKPPKRWSINAGGGADWVTNPNTESRVDAHRTTGPIESAPKYTNSLGGSYEFLRHKKVTGKLSYSYSGTLYGDSDRNLNTFGHTFGVNFSHNRTLWGKPLTLQLAHSTAYTIVDVKYYSTGFSETLTAIYSVHDRWRATLTEKFSFTTYDSDGTNPDSTSRDGFGNTSGISNTIYLNKKKTVYSTLGFDYGYELAQGINYIKDIFTYNTALHFPLKLRGIEADLSFKFKDTQYPKYGFPTTTVGRRDLEYALTATLSKKISKYWTLKGAYSYTNIASRDDAYTYTNHSMGSSLSYSF